MCQSCFNKSDLVGTPMIIREDLVEYEDVSTDEFENEEEGYDNT